MKIKSKKQFWWRLNHLKRNGGEITVTDRTPEMDVAPIKAVKKLQAVTDKQFTASL